MDTIYLDGRHYDRMFPGRAEIPFLLEQVRFCGESFDACMACVRGHLAEGGRFIIDVYVPSLPLLMIDPNARRKLTQYDDPDGAGRIVVTHTASYDAITQITSARTFHQIPADGRVTEADLHPRTAIELPAFRASDIPLRETARERKFLVLSCI